MYLKDNRFHSVGCIVCGGLENESIYESEQHGGKTLGRISIKLSCCKSCGFVWQNPQLTEFALTQYYKNDLDASGSTYHFGNENGVVNSKQKNRVFFSPFIEKIASQGKILEIGCSSGDFLQSLRLPNWELYGVEPSAFSSKIAVERGISVYKGLLGEIELPKKNFDVIAIFSVLEHLPNLEKHLTDISETLKSEGVLIFEVPDSLKAEPQVSEFFTFEHLWHFTKKSVTELLVNYGFSEFIFDESVTDSRIRCVAKRSSAIKQSSPVVSDGMLLNKITSYQVDRTNLIQNIENKLIKFLGELNDGGTAIYGGGIHTYYFLDSFEEFFSIDCIVDSNKNKWGLELLGIPIISFEHALEKNITNFIISSKCFESEIFEFLSSFPKLNILRIYNE